MTTNVKQSRDEAIAELLELAPHILVGSTSETYRTCGNKSCRCHGEGPKHGPHMYVSYKGEHGKTTGYYVPVALHDRVRDGLGAWRRFRELARQIAYMNKELMDAERPRKKRGERA